MNAVYCTVCGHNFQTQFNPHPGAPGPPQAQPHWDPNWANRPDSNRMLITLLLWFFVGHFGAHRFYLGHVNTAVIMLVLYLIGWATICLVVGWFALVAVWIWWIVDLIQILTGQLRPIDGSRLV